MAENFLFVFTKQYQTKLCQSHDNHETLYDAMGLSSGFGGIEPVNDNADIAVGKQECSAGSHEKLIQQWGNNLGVHRHFGIVKRVNVKGKDSVVHECTQELFEQCLNSPKVAEVKKHVMELQRQRDDGSITKEMYEEETAKAKRNLPAVTPFGMYQGGVRKSDSLLPSGFNMLDYDHKDDVVEFTQRLMDKIEKAGLLPYVALVQISIRGEGVHAFFVNPDGMDIETGQAWFASKIDEPDYDAACKDGARAVFLSPASDVVYKNDTVLFGEGPKAPRATVDELNGAAKLLESKGVKTRRGGNCSQGKLREVEWDDKNLPADYCGVPLKKIMDEYVNRVFGGEPAVGSRHTTLRQLMQQISGICNHNPALIASVVPDCGLPKSELVSLAKWAAETSNGTNSHELDGIISQLRAEAAVTVQNADGTTTVLPNAMQTVEDKDEELELDTFYKTTKHELVDDFAAIVSDLPAPIRDTLQPVEKDMQLAVFLSIMPVLATAADGVLIESVDGGLKPMAIFTVVQGGPASNKGWCVKAVKMWLHVFEQADRLAEQRYEEEMKEWNKRKDKSVKNKPKCSRRILPIDFTTAAYIEWAENNPGHAAISYSSETSFLTDSNKAGAFAKTLSIFLVAYDGDEYAHQRFGKDSKSGRVEARMNLTMVGTDIAFDELFLPKNVMNGLASRFFTYALDDDDDKDFGPAPKEPKWSDTVRQGIDGAIRSLCEAKGVVGTPRSLEEMTKWQQDTKNLAESLKKDHEMAICTFRAAPDALKVAAILKLLTPNGEETDATVKAALIAAKIKWLEQYYRFGMIMHEHRLNKKNKRVKMDKKISANYVALAMMPDEFTIDKFIEAKKKKTGKDVQIKSIRSKLSQMMTRGDIELIAENTYRKIPSA